MNVVIFGATGMVGQGVLRECIRDPGVTRVLIVGRSPSSMTDAAREKVQEIVMPDMTDYSQIASEFSGYDACFFCLGVSSAGMSEAQYRSITRDIAVAAAQTMATKSPNSTFIFVSGAGADSSGKSRTMWARVKGETENAILDLPFKGKYVFRPAFIKPEDGITSRTPSYRVLYKIIAPLFPLLNALVPSQVTTTRRIGQAMLNLTKQGATKPILNTADINAAAKTNP